MIDSSYVTLGSMSLKASGSNPNGSKPIAAVTFVKRSPLMVREPVKFVGFEFSLLKQGSGPGRGRSPVE